MSTFKRGILVHSGEWAKHLRPWGKAAFWGRHRMAERDLTAAETRDWRHRAEDAFDAMLYEEQFFYE